MKAKLCVFSSDPIQKYVAKGEIKPRYFNPLNIFDEVHIMNPSTEHVDIESVRVLAGNAALNIYPIGKFNVFNMQLKKRQILNLVREIQPDIIRAYNPLVQGWLAAYCSKKLKIPYMLSIHGEYQKEIEKEYKESGQIFKYFKLLLTRIITQKSAISLADCVVCVYKDLVSYAESHNAKSIQVIYNRIDLGQFSDSLNPALKMDKPIILNIGNFRKIKNQECLIRAVRDLDVYLVLIGKGEMLDALKYLVRELGVDKKVFFLDSVQHSRIQDYYASATIFAMPMKTNGIAIPVLEALAAGCITVVAEPDREKNEPIDNFVKYVKNDPDSFRDVFLDIIRNPFPYKKNTIAAKEVLKTMDQSVTEAKEASLYEQYFKINT